MIIKILCLELEKVEQIDGNVPAKEAEDKNNKSTGQSSVKPHVSLSDIHMSFLNPLLSQLKMTLRTKQVLAITTTNLSVYLLF